MSRPNKRTGFFSLLASETRGILILLIICSALVGITFWVKHSTFNITGTQTEISSELKAYLNSPIKKININTADSAALIRLKGIGPATAKNIITYRNEHGAFKNIYELDSVRGIGTKTIRAIDSFITTGVNPLP